MPYVVAEPCIQCKYTDCVEVCPVDCFYEGANMIVIHPDECIDCGACMPECPTEAIFLDTALPGKWRKFIKLNERFSRAWPNLAAKKPPLEDADQWKGVAKKLKNLSERPG